MASIKWSKVHRVTNLPEHVDRLATTELLADCIPGLGVGDIQVCSLATAVDSQSKKIATVIFRAETNALSESSGKDRWEFRVSGCADPIVLDVHFYGLTPLNDVHYTAHANDCVVISGLGSHPMGSWQPRGDKTFMWIRDSLPGLLDDIRFILYGYNTKLLDSKSIQAVPDLARSFIAALQAGNWMSKPLIFLAHSLGGVLMKQSIVALEGTQEDQQILDLIRGGIFFGVPSVGMSVQDLENMIGEQPNRVLINCLSDNFNFVRNLEEHFERVSSPRMRVVWAYETQETLGLSKSDGSWKRSGPAAVMVSPSSATGGRHKFIPGDPAPIRSNDEWIVQIDADHSNMVKFAMGDQLIMTMADKIRQILGNKIQHAGERRLDDRLFHSTAAHESDSSFRKRCKDLHSALIHIEILPDDMVSKFDIDDDIQRLVSASFKVISMGRHIRYLVRNSESQISEWIEGLEDLKWVFQEMPASLMAQSTRVVNTLASCTHSCLDIIDIIESTCLSATGFFRKPPNEHLLKQILASSNNRDEEIRAGFEALKRSRSALIGEIEFLIADLTPDMFPKLRDSLDLTPEEAKCIGALRMTDPSYDREGITADKGEIVKGTCKWILSTHQFEEWIQSPGTSRTLWISAPPGMGKTYLSIFLSRRLQRLCGVQENSISIFFFCDNRVDTRNTSSGILRGLIYQLTHWRKELIKFPLQKWRAQDGVFSQNTSFQSLWELFEDMIDSLPDTTVYCTLDALDECEAESMVSLLNKLQRRVETKSKFKFIAVSRRHPEHIAEALFSSITVEIDDSAHARDDVKRYISQRVHHLARIKRFLNEPLHHHIEEVFDTKAQDTFLWVSFMIHDLLQKTVVQIEASLEKLPTGINAVYDRILAQIGTEQADTVSKMLGWITLAARPLAVSELCEALRIQSTSHLTRERVCLDYILSCGNLLQVTEVWAPDIWTEVRKSYQGIVSDSSVENSVSSDQNRGKNEGDVQLRVTLVHQSAKDYLLEKQSHIGSAFHIDDPEAVHEQIATRLLLEMSGGCLGISTSVEDWEWARVFNWPLAVYAIRSWDFHFNQIADYQGFARRHDAFFSASSSLREKWYRCRANLFVRAWVHDSQCDDPIPLLHMAVELDLVGAARQLLYLQKQQLGSSDFERYVNRQWGNFQETALHMACAIGGKDMIQLLIEYGADAIGIRDGYGGAALEIYCVNFDECDPFIEMSKSEGGKEFLGEEGGNLLRAAAARGHRNICRLLVESYGVDVDDTDQSGNTPLTSALEHDELEIARIFVNDWHASLESHWELVESAAQGFLKNDNIQIFTELVKVWGVNINACDPSTGKGLMHGSLWSSISKEHTAILLRLGLDPSIQDRRGTSILHAIVSFPDEINIEVVRLLLQDGRLRLPVADCKGRTILHKSFEYVRSRYYIERVTPFDCQVICRNIRHMLDLGVNRTSVNIDGETALDLVNDLLDYAWEDCPVTSEPCSTNQEDGAEPDNKIGFMRYAEIDFMRYAKVLQNYTTVPLFSDGPPLIEASIEATRLQQDIDSQNPRSLSTRVMRYYSPRYYVGRYYSEKRWKISPIFKRRRPCLGWLR
ncbi:unnamed protein product [Clonostachys rhizophaga]|uniref:Nephrocystin 3-like N-terminal domain-containing protein n=1 Tax=Clonostachys rhizophaga TaxID=160324 RepID=A0A9N9VCS7_9HYPO|nr:unnamed protein product [Clonostachys rhizophaga]